MGALHVEIPDGLISVTQCGRGEYLARLRWAGDYGTRDLARASFEHIIALVREQVTYGITYPPLYHGRDGDLELTQDGTLFRKVLPEGELRIVAHHDGFIGLLVQPNSLRLLGWADDFKLAHEVSRRQIHRDHSTRMTVRLRGRLRDLKVCSAEGILAYLNTDDLFVFVVPGTPFVDRNGLWDAPVTVTVVRSDQSVVDVWTHPSLCDLDGNEVVWSEEWSSDPPPLSADSRLPSKQGPPDPPQPRTRETASALAPDVIALFLRYLDTLDHTTGSGQSMRQQLDPLLRACVQVGRGDIRGCGRRLRTALVDRGGLPLCGSERAFRHAIAFFHHACPLLVKREGKRDTVIAFSDLRSGTALAAWLREKLAAHDPPSQPDDTADDPLDTGGSRTTEPERHPPSNSTTTEPPAAEPQTFPPWFDERSSPELAASVASYLGPANPNTSPFVTRRHAESPLRVSLSTGPPTSESDPHTKH